MSDTLDQPTKRSAPKRRKKRRRKAEFASESDMCTHFINKLPEEWVAYPEWGNWDILLVRKKDGFQVGIEAKLRLNAKVISQSAETAYHCDKPGPDCRAILIPKGSNLDFQPVCNILSLQIIEIESEISKSPSTVSWYRPKLPNPDRASPAGNFKEFYPSERLELPEIIPIVAAGKPSPIKLTPWKIKAIKLDILLQKHGVVTRKLFKALNLSTTLFLHSGNGWMLKGSERGAWTRGPSFPDFRIGCEENYDELEKRYKTWVKTLPMEGILAPETEKEPAS
ncbi:hypothetical protein PsAD46_03967 [Pseudovibrio sp. Ad46]|uniref:hypothetical protein n=1 Tax=unclassified Pseudovibrio TaxID=2627060 RepID=UPI0007AEA0AB|nr:MULTISPECIES: hypothetical protein [unclassified Pseudovibrio]KZK80919.1 hypothetical protein PsAD46_03967 [Pseudovibrio sp. Ad46]KZK96418.1 hypothetical protein PsAD5_02610 [Pseudovibrio sp. Ad5]